MVGQVRVSLVVVTTQIQQVARASVFEANRGSATRQMPTQTPLLCETRLQEGEYWYPGLQVLLLSSSVKQSVGGG